MNGTVTCILCPLGCIVRLLEGRPSGARCREGRDFALREAANPVRFFTGSVRVSGGDFAMLSVRTSRAVAKGRITDIASLCRRLAVPAPVQIGQTLLSNVLGTGADLVATRTVCRACGGARQLDTGGEPPDNSRV